MCVCGVFLAEVRRSVLFLGAHLGLGLHAQIVVQRRAVAGVGGQPQRARQRLAIVCQRQLQAVHRRAAMVAVRVVQLGLAQPHLHVGHAHAVGRAVHQRAILRANGHIARVAHRITQEVGRQLLVRSCLPGLLAQRGKGAMQLGGHGVQQDGRRACCAPAARRAKHKRQAAATVKSGKLASEGGLRLAEAKEICGIGRENSSKSICILDCLRVRSPEEESHDICAPMPARTLLQLLLAAVPPVWALRPRLMRTRLPRPAQRAQPRRAAASAAQLPQQAYSLPPDKLAKAIALSRIRNIIDMPARSGALPSSGCCLPLRRLPAWSPGPSAC